MYMTLTRSGSAVASDLDVEVLVTTQWHHEAWGSQMQRSQPVSEGRRVLRMRSSLTTVSSVGTQRRTRLRMKPHIGGGVVELRPVGNPLGLAEGEVVTTLKAPEAALSGFSFGSEFVEEHAVAPAAIVVQQSQRTDALVEHEQVPGVMAAGAVQSPGLRAPCQQKAGWDRPDLAGPVAVPSAQQAPSPW